MQSILTLLQGNQNLLKETNEQGFSLLEVIVALAIMAIGYITVLQLYSGSIRSVSISEQYLKATTLAQSKMNELEINNYQDSEFEGRFKEEKKYKWHLKISPYNTPLNKEENRIRVSEVALNVIWSDANKVRNIALNTLKVDGILNPTPDSLLVKSFSGGTGSINQETPEVPKEVTPKTSQNICGSITSWNSNISGSSTPHISGN